MLTVPIDVLHQFPVRKTKRQKQAFRDAVASYAEGLGYPVRVEKGSMGSRNVVIGRPEQAKYLVTAHYDTPARMLVPNFITPRNLLIYLAYQVLIVLLFMVVSGVLGGLLGVLLDSPELGGTAAMAIYLVLLLLLMAGPANKTNANDNTSGVVSVLEVARSLPPEAREQVCFVLFDLEELGLVGSSSYRKAHKKQTQTQVVLNMDCVGDGDEILILPSRRLKKDRETVAAIKDCEGQYGHKRVTVLDRGFAFYPSDQSQFPLGVGIAAFHKKKIIGLYLSRIHTSRDIILEEENVTLLRDCILSLISRSEKKGTNDNDTV